MNKDDLVEHDAEVAGASKGTFVVPAQHNFSDQTGADQSAADSDRDESATDQASSTADQVTAREDQRASDRDQATSDRQHDAAAHLTSTEERAYEAARGDRLAVSLDRQRNSISRDRTTRLRAATAVLRDGVSRSRLRSSAIRKRLIADGETADIAVRWCDAWEVEAAGTGIAHDRDYWNRGTHWIWAERAAGRRP